MAWQDLIGSYSVEYVPQAVLDAMATSHTLGIFFRLETDPGLHIWAGVNDIPAGFDSIDPDGTVYLGGGRLLNIPTLEVLVNGQSSSVEFGISGIDPATAQKVVDTMPDVRGKDLKIGFTTLDEYYQPMSSIVALWTGTASHPTESSPPVTGGEDKKTTLSLAVVSGTNTRSRASQVLWTPAHQKALYPTDEFCSGVARLGRGVAPAWPDY
ncbi:MAG: hypothetical protein E5X53_26355 [Mesorhizobium sp.]|uniref:hypothetical protein n=1 Tax=Mesorhizobium sp. TaxID=1871066 RepID=UPI001218D7AE|nr:hypothetical protein [Mesorhizobium sp.]TIP70588.1 MAG: hypothetical protein E5X55_26605 [Mesorhizobium sp.]TIQ06778.1 MAG: hypothetical protein E5X57_24315 [Mesorhizobium sp.]TIR49022.1 MAG: hypothetical protein E5X53_26355 [Mesorhizobium sp.]TJV94857.1 MAG: hypothetical protein E5X52_26880 [Mesorhizobium sp.]